MAGSLGPALRWAVSANAIANLANVAGLVIFARLLGTDVVGTYGFMVVLIELVSLFLSFGFNQAVIRYSGDQQVFSAALTLTILQSVGLLIAVSAAFWVATGISLGFQIAGASVTALLASKLLTTYTILAYAHLESALNYRPIAIAKAVAALAALAAGIAASQVVTASYLVLPIRDLTASFVMFALILPKSRFRYRISMDVPALSRVWTFTRPIWQLTLLERIALRADYAIVSQLLGASSFGVYYQVRSLVDGALGFLLDPIQTVLYTHYCRMEHALEAFRRTVQRWLLPAIVMTLAVLLILLTTTVGGWFVALMYGPEWRAGGALFAGFAVYMAAMISFEHAKVVSIAVQVPRPAILGRLLQMVLIAALVAPLTIQLELAGAGAATGAAAVCLSITTNVFLHRSGHTLAPGSR
jgi:O-antigen/teichoic acid export membrane protein